MKLNRRKSNKRPTQSRSHEAKRRTTTGYIACISLRICTNGFMHSSRNIVSYRLVKRTSTVVLMFEFQMGIEKLLRSKYFQYNIAILTECIAISILG